MKSLGVLITDHWLNVILREQKKIENLGYTKSSSRDDNSINGVESRSE